MRLIEAALVVGLVVGICLAKFDPCRFNFGFKDGTANINEADIVAQYTSGDYTGMLNKCKSSNKTPAVYMYIIAKSSGLGDCNTGGGLCSQGANYIRNNKDKIKGYYRDCAASIKNTFGSTNPVICVMEPDYFQYTANTQQGGGLSYQDAGQFMGELVDIVKGQLPNALISLDISPWMEDQEATNSWLTALPLSKIQYMSTTGGISQAASYLIKKENRLLWKKVHDITNKCIIADCGYGTGGGGTGHDAAWDNVTNLNDRINDGVIGIIQFSPKQDWGNTIKSISGQLSKPICSCAGTYTLTLAVGSNGKVTKSPDAASYDSGAVVTLTAVPNSGYKLRSWSGDVAGTNATVNLTMTANKKVAATFVDVNAKPSYTLTVNTTGSGIVEVTPKQADFDSGATVSLAVFGVNGASFNGWGGALSGSGRLVTLVMDGNKTVTASFTGNNLSPPVNLVKNGDFSDNANNWDLGTFNNAKATGNVDDGAYKLTIETPGTETWHIQFLQGGISLKQNEDYILTFTASSQANTSIIVNVGMAADPFTSYSQERTIELTPTEKTYEVKFTMKEASTANARLEFNSGKANGAWRIDDISLSVSVALILQAAAPAPFFNVHDAFARISRNKRASISWYDHAGRLLHSFSGDYGILTREPVPQRSGSFIAVIRIDDRQFVKKIFNFRK
jgi:hypothetical protein